MSLLEEMRRRAFSLVGLFYLSSCGVDVGNPVEPSPNPPALSVSFALFDGSDDLIGEKLILNIEDITLIGSKDQIEIFHTLKPNKSSFNLYSGDEAKEATLEVSASAEVIDGTYDFIALNLNKEEPGALWLTDNEQKPLAFEESGVSSIFIPEKFEIKKGEKTELVLWMDLKKSILNPNQMRPKFNPHFSSFRKRLGVSYEARVENSDAVLVCAYLYEPALKKQFSKLEKPWEIKKGLKKGWRAKRRKFFEAKEDLVKDEELQCANAFTRRKVKDGRVHFKHLVPGRYDFRVFLSSGGFEDLATDVELAPK